MTNYKQLHQHYLEVLAMDGLDHGTKKAMVECIVGQLPGRGWIVKGITQAALEALAENNYKKGPKVVRGHVEKRHDTYTTLVETPFLDYQEWFDFIIANTTTYVCTKDENKKHGTGHWSRTYDFNDKPEWLFEAVKIGFAHRKCDADWLREWDTARPTV